MVPGNAVAAQLANLHGTITPATLKGLYEEFGLSGHQSAWDQYVHYWGQLLHGNLGTSTSFYPTSVSSVIGGGIYWTLGLVGIATVISFALGTALGIVVAWRRGSVLDNLLPALTFFQAAPYFFLAILLVALLGSGLHWFPVLGVTHRSPLRPGTWVTSTTCLTTRSSRRSRSCSRPRPAGPSACGT